MSAGPKMSAGPLYSRSFPARDQPKCEDFLSVPALTGGAWRRSPETSTF